MGHVYMYTCIHVYMYTYTHIYMYTYIHIYIYTYIHIYIYTYMPKWDFSGSEFLLLGWAWRSTRLCFRAAFTSRFWAKMTAVCAQTPSNLPGLRPRALKIIGTLSLCCPHDKVMCQVKWV